jgi:hypothetical protein
MGWAAVTNGGDKECVQIFGGKSPRKRLLGRPRKIWENNVEIDLGEISCEDRKWVELAQDRVQWRALASSVFSFRYLLPQL